MAIEIGKTADTPWGRGVIVGYNTMVKRWAVRVEGYKMPRLVPAKDIVIVE